MTDDFTGELDYRLKHTNSEVGKLSEIVSGLEFEFNRLNQDLFNVRDELNNQIHLLRSELTHLIKIANPNWYGLSRTSQSSYSYTARPAAPYPLPHHRDNPGTSFVPIPALPPTPPGSSAPSWLETQ